MDEPSGRPRTCSAGGAFGDSRNEPVLGSPRKPVWRRWWFIAAAALVLLVVLANVFKGPQNVTGVASTATLSPTPSTAALATPAP